MFLMYVDESGDAGTANSPTRYFVLSGLVVHELRWESCLSAIIDFRRQMLQRFGLKLREEFHASHLFTRPGDLVRIKRHDRLAMVRHFADMLAAQREISVINIIIDKTNKPPSFDVFGTAWNTLIQRFENTLSHHNFPGPGYSDERGQIFSDHTDDKKLVKILRRMRRYNPIPHQQIYGSGYRNLPFRYIIEDISFRDSEDSYFIQAIDLAAFLLYQRFTPSKYFRMNSGQNYFNRLRPILCLVASSTDPDGIVRI
jgi:hypothetical protein